MEAGEGRGVGSGDWDEAELSRGPLRVLVLERKKGSGTRPLGGGGDEISPTMICDVQSTWRC